MAVVMRMKPTDVAAIETTARLVLKNLVTE
jgi:hypothetical protein